MLEVCVDSKPAAILAVSAGAQRIELSTQLSVGGLTPSVELVCQVRDAISVPLIVLVRSRPGDFYYDDHERDAMFQSTEQIAKLGVEGIAIGGLMRPAAIDHPWLRELTNSIDVNEWVMHRAFDELPDQASSLEHLIELGFQRVLTSGIPGNALDGVSRLRQLNQWSRERIEILPAGGIQGDNASLILESTRCRQLHGSFRVKAVSQVQTRSSLSIDSNSVSIDVASIRKTREILDAYLQANPN